MAGFTSLALLGGGLLAGMAINRGKKKDQSQALAPGPTNANEGALAPPAPPILNPGEINATAQAAGVKQRKRSAQGSLLTNATAPRSSTMPVEARFQPRSLLGS